MGNKHFLLLLMVSFVCWSCANMQPLRDSISFISVFNKFDTLAAVSAADEILADLKNFVTDKDYYQLGFDSLADLQSAVRGTPIRVFTVMYSAIKFYKDNLDTKDCVVKDEYVHFPVKVKGVVTTSLELFKGADNSWKFARFGNPMRARLISAVMDSLSHLPLIPRDVSFFYLQIPSKYMSFIGYYNERDLRMYLAPLADREKSNFIKWVFYDAKSILKKLK